MTSLLKVFDIAASAMTAQSQRLNVVASNLANADSATGPDGNAYKAKQVVFSTQDMGGAENSGVRVTGVVEDPSPMKRMYQPGHPMADKEGYVTMPNVSVVDEMVNMISASRAYQNNVEAINTAKTLLAKTLTIGQ
ncbi:MAG TPA: flagellar basal body rod protein FlgC [Burkholderiales bacterium]|nr:flagellar basal body rod protein FlgC [Burkholderiales bacterium]